MSPHVTPIDQRTELKKDSVARKSLRELARRDADRAREDALLAAVRMGIMMR